MISEVGLRFVVWLSYSQAILGSRIKQPSVTYIGSLLLDIACQDFITMNVTLQANNCWYCNTFKMHVLLMMALPIHLLQCIGNGTENTFPSSVNSPAVSLF